MRIPELLRLRTLLALGAPLPRGLATRLRSQLLYAEKLKQKLEPEPEPEKEDPTNCAT